MMRFFMIILLLFTILFSGCGIIRIAHYYSKPSLYFELNENNGWKILTPPNEWDNGYKCILLPQYFTGTQIRSYGTSTPTNNFYAIYNNSIFIYIWNTHMSPFTINKIIHGEDKNATILYYDNKKGCVKDNRMNIVIAINKINACFNNKYTYFMKDKRKIQGNEIKFTSRPFVKHERLPPAVYNLASDTVIKSKQMEIVMGPPWNFSSFMFIFDDMTCTDYEDAVLVIDGFSKNGEKIPPLKVRMNYYDFAAVPEYKEPGGDVRR